ncbi:MAG: DUF1109 domain-containing protein [Haloarculaceae archaeon]
MNFDIDSAKLLYALGVLFAAAAFVYFIRDLVFGLSITVKALLLFVAFVGFFITSLALQRDILDVVALALSALAYVVCLGYVLARYNLGDTATFLVFAGSAILFVGLGYLLREQSPSLSLRTAGYAILGLAAISAVLVGADLADGGVTYTMALNETVTVSGPGDSPVDRDLVPAEAHIGTVTATNDFLFTRPLDLPTLRGCVVGTDAVPDDRVSISYDRRSFDRTNIISGNTERPFAILARLPIAANETQSLTFTVERATTCDISRSDPTLVVVSSDSTQSGE